MACLVQQLFRQKIGQQLDQGLLDEVLFPMLRRQKYLPYTLLLDIKLTQRWTDYGESLISTYDNRALVAHAWPYPHRSVIRSISPFTLIPLGFGDQQDVMKRQAKGKVTSQFRRSETHYRDWGTVDILNELRTLKHPRIEDHPHPYHARQYSDRMPWDPCNAYIRLVETDGDALKDIAVSCCKYRGAWCGRDDPDKRASDNDRLIRETEEKVIKQDLLFINVYLEDSLTNGVLRWGGDPSGLVFKPTLRVYCKRLIHL